MGHMTSPSQTTHAAPARPRTASRMLVRGNHRFTVTADGDGGIRVQVDSGGRALAHGPLVIFQRAELESVRYRLKYHRAAVKPVAQVGSVLIGPDALEALQGALAELREELGTP